MFLFLSFSFPEEFVSVEVADEFEACFYQLACFFFGVSYFGGEVFVFEAYELGVEHGVEEGFVSEDLFHVEDVAGFVVFHCGFPMSESVEGYMRLGESILKCYECRETSDYEEVEIVQHDGKKYWICSHCDMETEIVDEVMPKFSQKSNSRILHSNLELLLFNMGLA